MLNLLKRFKKIKKENLMLKKALYGSSCREVQQIREISALKYKTHRAELSNLELSTQKEFLETLNNSLESQLSELKIQYKNSATKNEVKEILKELESISNVKIKLEKILEGMN